MQEFGISAASACGRDLAAAVARYERLRYDRAHYVVDSAQAAHFKAVHAALQAADYSPAAKYALELTLELGIIEHWPVVWIALQRSTKYE